MTKALSLNEIRSRAAQFVVTWREIPGDERQEGQNFVRDLLHIFGVSETRAALYEKRAKRSSTGKQGYIDALVPGTLIIEMKSEGHDLGLAAFQALDYMDDLTDIEQPRFVLTSDFKTFRLLDLHGQSGEDTTIFTLEELPRKIESLAFLAGYQVREFGSKEQEAASIKAAKIMADLYGALEGSGYDDHEASIFLVRILFCLYADDAAVWQKDLFTEFLETRTNRDGSDLGPQLSFLFQVLNQPESNRLSTLDELFARFPYVNGRVFEETLSIPSFTREMREKLVSACAFNWAEISPAIFGSLFQAVKSPEARRKLGEHYTTEKNILKVVGPLFLNELQERFERDRNNVRALEKLRQDMSKMRFLDPACGCGNFLVVTYRELRALELEILKRLQELGQMKTLFFERDDLAVGLHSMVGLEVEEWPARIAQTALRLADHQANMQMELVLGKAPETLPLDNVVVIHTGNALRMDWQALIPKTSQAVIMGNPPFIGMAWLSKAQQDDNRHVFAEAEPSGKLRTGRLDYVANWFARAAQFIQARPTTRAAFVSTNSITQGEQARTMVPFLSSKDCAVEFGHQTFKWTSEVPGAAAVHCVIVGLAHRSRVRTPRRLFTYPSISADPVEMTVDRLNFYLVDGPDFVPVKLRRSLVASMPDSYKGSQPTDGGHLLLTPEEAEVLSSVPEVAPYVRRFVQARDMLQGAPLRMTLWLKQAPPQVLRHPLVRERLERVRDNRLKSPTASVRDAAATPALFTQDRQPSTPYFALPEVSSEHREWIPGRMFTPDVIAGNKLIIFPEAELWHAAFLQSSMFMAWVKTFAGRLKSDVSISPGLAYFPIPWPIPTDDEKTALTGTIEQVFTVRDQYPEATLADLYDPVAMPSELLMAHQYLDRVVDRTFGASNALRSEQERLAVLFERYTAAVQLSQK